MAFGQQSAGNSRRAASRQRDFLAKRNLRKAREELLFGIALQLGGDGGRKRELDEIHQIEVADETQCDKARPTRMKAECLLDTIAFKERLALAHFLEDFTGKILPLQK